MIAVLDNLKNKRGFRQTDSAEYNTSLLPSR